MRAHAYNFINKKISRRFSFAVAATILVVMAIFLVVDIESSVQSEQKKLDDKMATFLEITKNALAQAVWNFDEKSEISIAESLMKDAEVARIIIYNESDRLLYTHNKAAQPYEDNYLILKRVAITYEGKTIGHAELYFTTYYLSQNISTLINRQLLKTSILMLSMVFTVFLIAKRITKPIEYLSRETTQIAAGDLNRRISVPNRDEIGNLADKLNIMVTSLAEAHDAIARDAVELEVKNKEILIYSEELEALVEARTSDYNQANHALKLKNEELEQTLTIYHETQDQLIETKKMAALGTLVAGVAHEINTPLGNGITMASYLSMLRADLVKKLDAGTLSKQDLNSILTDFRDAIHILSTNLDRSANLVQHFKQLAVDLSTNEQSHFNLYENIETVIISMKHEFANAHHRIENRCPKGLMLNSYPGEYAQILTHLLRNSLTHGFVYQDAGLIEIEVSTTDDEQLVIVYADNGVGITEDNLSRIFDPFYTTNRSSGNAGLGLNIVYNIVTHKLQGSIRCISAPSAGVRFVISLPLGIKP